MIFDSLDLPDDAQIVISKNGLIKMLEKASNQGAYQATQRHKQMLDFPRDRSFDDLPPLVRKWRQYYEDNHKEGA